MKHKFTSSGWLRIDGGDYAVPVITVETDSDHPFRAVIISLPRPPGAEVEETLEEYCRRQRGILEGEFKVKDEGR